MGKKLKKFWGSYKFSLGERNFLIPYVNFYFSDGILL